MSRNQTIITSQIYNEAQLQLKNLSSKQTKEKHILKAIISAKDNGITLAAKILNIPPITIRRWAVRFQKEGINGLQCKKGRGRKTNVPEAVQNIIKQWVHENNSMTLKEIVIKLKDFNVKTSISAVHRIMKQKLGLSYITARPVHYKQNKELQKDFKKKITIAI